MKKLFYGMLLLLVCFAFPAYAETASTTPIVSLTLNHLTYSPIHKAEIIDNTLYLSGEDLASMTYGTWKKSESGEMLTIQNKKISYSADSRDIQIDGLNRQLTDCTKKIGDLIYVPICLLDSIQYSYTLSEEGHALSIIPTMPYSTSVDQYSTHEIYSTDIRTLQEVLSPLIPVNKLDTFIREAQSNKRYIGFMTTKYKSQCLEALQNNVIAKKKDARYTNVHFRKLNCSNDIPTLSDFTSLPVKYTVTSDGLNISLGDHKCANPFFWAVYNPIAQNQTAIDLNKSLDAMVMRSIYVYYRDQYGLKDDLETSSMTQIKMGRSDEMTYQVYLDNGNPHTQYQVTIYKKSTSDTVDYYVDLIAI